VGSPTARSRESRRVHRSDRVFRGSESLSDGFCGAIRPPHDRTSVSACSDSFARFLAGGSTLARRHISTDSRYHSRCFEYE